ncbi:MAG: hypothetical protein JSU77_12995 [Fidelibacterota bacterium]|nr:MAG: hypothetical protein JSU77_12995 [Candidatus Neomarinimicrobiota bacterium]
MATLLKVRGLTLSIRIGLLALAALLLSGCLTYRLTEFTDQIRKADQLSVDELKRVQFYTSHTLIFTAVSETRESPPPEPRRKPKLDTRYVDQVKIRRHTPGVVITAGDRWLDVSFEEGKWLRFTQKPSGRYLLDAKTVTYGGKLYRVECVPRRFSECPVSLRIRKSLKPKIKVRSQKVKGRQP